MMSVSLCKKKSCGYPFSSAGFLDLRAFQCQDRVRISFMPSARDHGVEADVFNCSYDGEGVEEVNKRREQDWQWSSWLILAAHAVVLLALRRVTYL